LDINHLSGSRIPAVSVAQNIIIKKIFDFTFLYVDCKNKCSRKNSP
jgi:hypothetical protein